jgi:hypothetical protein
MPVPDENGKLFVKSPSYSVLEESSRILERWFGCARFIKNDANGRSFIDERSEIATVLARA